MGFTPHWHSNGHVFIFISNCDDKTSINVSASKVTPSSVAWGDDHERISSTHVSFIEATPMEGITAMGLRCLGITTNQGRVGLCQIA